MTQPATPTAADRLLRAFRALVRGEDPNRTFAGGPWEYQVQRADGSTFDGSPAEQALPLPPLVGVPYRSALAGTTCVPKVGSLALVSFINGDPTRPIVWSFGPPPGASGAYDTQPDVIRLDAALVTVGDPGGTPKAVARVDDHTANGTLTGANSGGAVTFVYTPPFGPVQTATTITLVGQINTGSPKLQSE